MHSLLIQLYNIDKDLQPQCPILLVVRPPNPLATRALTAQLPMPIALLANRNIFAESFTDRPKPEWDIELGNGTDQQAELLPLW